MAEATALDADIVIVGGGIAGLALARALGAGDQRIVVLEAREPPAGCGTESGDGASVESFDARVSALTPKSIGFLRSLGVWNAVEKQRQCPYSHMTVWDAEGTGRIDFDAQEVAAPSLGSIVENRVIVAALAQRVAQLPRVELRAPARLADLAIDEAAVELILDDGRRLRSALVVAADGALSPTRERLRLRTREWDYHHRAIVTTAAFERPHEHTAWQRFLPTGPLALLPLASADDRLCSIVWSIEEDRADALLDLDDAAFAAALADASEHALGAVSACAPRRAFPLRQRHAVDYVLPRAALVGDAAHSIHPLAGQGINLGLADVAVLAAEIEKAASRALDVGRIDVLRRYQRQRKADNLRMMAAMDGFKRLFEQDALPLRWLRNTGMRGVAALPGLKRRIIREAMGA